MRDGELGRLVRALRRRKGWRQEDCARHAGVHRSTWSRLERGRLDGATIRVVRGCLSVVDVELDLVARGDRAGFDRLLDEDHAAVGSRWAHQLRRDGWQTWAERSYSHFGERGRVDLLAWHPTVRILAVIEVKTELADVQALLGLLDAKVRLGPVLARELGLPQPTRVVPVLIFRESMTTRRRVARVAPLFHRFDLRGAAARAWFRRPLGGQGLLLFSGAPGGRGGHASARNQRVRLPRSGVG